MKNWQEEIIQKVWEKGIEVSGVDGKLWRKDIAGAWMSRRLYGKQFSEYGWEIDHIKPDNGNDNQPIHFSLSFKYELSGVVI